MTLHLFDEDRLRGAALPTTLHEDGYQRIAAKLHERRAREEDWTMRLAGYVPVAEAPPPPAAPRAAPAAVRPMQRFASLEQARSAGFSRVAAGTYKKAHDIWELRRAEDGSDDVCLVRKREERASDMRDAARSAPPSTCGGPGLRTANRGAGRRTASVGTPRVEAVQTALGRQLLALWQNYVTERATDVRRTAAFERAASAPKGPGWEHVVREMKQDPGIDNPFALAHWMHNKGIRPKGGERKESDEMEACASGNHEGCGHTAAAMAARSPRRIVRHLAELRGQRVLAVHDGEVAEGTVLDILPMGDLDVDFGDAVDGHGSVVPLDMVLDPDCTCTREGHNHEPVDEPDDDFDDDDDDDDDDEGGHSHSEFFA